MVLRIGHRGAMGYEPENTLLSFRKALELHCDLIELDVRLCGSGELVVLHDETLDRTTSGKGPVSHEPWERLRTLDAGKGERIPRLEDVLEFVGTKACINIELKATGTARKVAKLIHLAPGPAAGARANPCPDILVSSFDCEELSALRKLSPEMPLGILLEEIPAGLFEFCDAIRACSLHLQFRLASAETVGEIHRRAMKVFVWTVDEPDDIARMKSIGVDGIISNYPDRI